MPPVPMITLSNGVAMPQLGYGVFRVHNEPAESAVATAIEVGYRSIDTAAYYRNEEGVGRAVASSGVARDDLFITTKLWDTDHGYDNALRAFDVSLGKLGLDHVDLYLIHWPEPRRNAYVETWRALERIYAEGRARAIGVSNFHPHRLAEVIDACEIVPMVNQIELHPWLTQTELRAFHAEHGIVTEGWSPLGHGGDLLKEPVLLDIAAAHDKSVAQVILRWNIQLGIVAIPKSATPSRIAENFDIFDFSLTEAELAAINALHTGTRTGPDPEARAAR
ncbi:aldo/keto reductase [Stackebrandtia soli]|uniref:aldo/keto reductase n=1 Tax=Stackebrandtia soli TaxID=1892856 RepID=UPI0039EA4C4B